MKYSNIQKATFIKRPNRFIAEVEIEGQKEIVHVKNTGRCKELLIPGAEVWLTAPGTPDRKTKYDLVAVRKSNGILFNIDSQAPNKVVKEWLEKKDYDLIKPEYTYGDSRIDFYMEKAVSRERYLKEDRILAGKQSLGENSISEKERFLMEVKGCTLEVDGIGYFPDAPTERGVKHIYELIKAKEEGYNAALAFVIQMDGVKEVRPNIETHPEFGIAFEEAKKAGVKIIFYTCHVTSDELVIVGMT
ncbi:DNA/RNA nuclease SfsA [Butyrivibrio sp. AC2005]|uniref:DNA/RNA nuclease SfsA n=1 Tax=Butyrivibrio sp. AC2005 TaxID=1280672 RepID=UPI0003F812B0|nr:DNA/RNA nuclease SfsA [Butyrivibrio sp. AC2005]